MKFNQEGKLHEIQKLWSRFEKSGVSIKERQSILEDVKLLSSGWSTIG